MAARKIAEQWSLSVWLSEEHLELLNVLCETNNWSIEYALTYIFFHGMNTIKNAYHFDSKQEED